ncbi:MAG: putative collagen-binding domain-containing protein, partial [Planctomycetota bacterium]
WRLIPAPEILTSQPGKEDASKFIAAAKIQAGDLAVVYLPEGGAVKVKTDSLKKGLVGRWYHPRTGGWLDAGRVAESVQTFKTVDRNDWVLLIKAK